jgi:uncharacterized protein
MFIKRQIEATLLRHALQYPVVAVMGARQSGKTTLVRHAFPNHPYISLEDPDTRFLATEDPRGFLNRINSGGIIDEIQRVPELLSYMQTHVDESGAPGQFIITGSNQFLLSKHISQSLAGRISLLKLMPFTVSELSDTLPGTAAKYIYTGSYPRIYHDSLSPSEWYLNYVETYIEKDLKDIINVSDLNIFRRFTALLASMCGQLVNLSQIGNALGISHNTAKAWLSALEQSYLIFLLQPYHKNYKKRLVKTPKLYFFDTGIACALLRLHSGEGLDTHHFYGALFENMVISEIMKETMHRSGRPNIYFWRDHKGREIDCVIESPDALKAIEIKSSQTIRANFFDNLSYFEDIAKDDNIDSALVYGGNTETTFKGIHAVNWQNTYLLVDKSESISADHS